MLLKTTLALASDLKWVPKYSKSRSDGVACYQKEWQLFWSLLYVGAGIVSVISISFLLSSHYTSYTFFISN